jgi:excinuclease UvrABC ATPase subunit
MITIVNASLKKVKSLTLNIPTNKIIVVTGEKGTGKSTLVKDIIFNEAKLRYFAAQGIHKKRVTNGIYNPKVQFISGLPPAIRVKRKSGNLVEQVKRLWNSGVRGVLYIIKNPTKDLSETEISTLIQELNKLKNLGNTLVIIEKNIPLIKHADYLIEMDADEIECKILFKGKPSEICLASQSKISTKIVADTRGMIPMESNVFDIYNPIVLSSVQTNRLKSISVEIPVNHITSIVGVAGSGKSSLAFNTLNEMAQNTFDLNSSLDNYEVINPNYLFSAIHGLMPTVAIDGLMPKTKVGDTVGSISGIYAHIRSVYKSMGKVDIQKLTLFGLYLDEMCSMQINKLLMEFRKQVVVPQSFSVKASEQRAMQIKAGSIINSLDILDKLGLGYLNLARQGNTLSSGELKRVRLSAGMSQDISGVCFVLDEPTSGLHPSDLDNLFFMLYELKRQGNTVVVCENNPGFIRYSDHVIELGLKGGKEGGKVIYQGDVKHLLTDENSIVSKYLNTEYEFKRAQRTSDFTNAISIKNASANNLKQINLKIPTHSLVVISGVSGSGKSSLMKGVIYESYVAGKTTHCAKIEGLELFNQVILIDSTIKVEEYQKTILDYLNIPDLTSRSVEPIGLSLGELLKTANHTEWLEFFDFITQLSLEYLSCNRQLHTLSLGELQRLKLVKTLYMNQGKNLLFLWDEPTAGLHMQDVEKLLSAFDIILDKGHSLIFIEHHKTVIENADYLIELGPGAGDLGGQVV